MAARSMMYIPIFMTFGRDVKAILRSGLSNLNSCNVGITDGRDS
jgi:hypothetical protein